MRGTVRPWDGPRPSFSVGVDPREAGRWRRPRRGDTPADGSYNQAHEPTAEMGPSELLEEAREAYLSGVEPETLVETYGPELQESGRVGELEDILDRRERSVLWDWVKGQSANGNGRRPADEPRHPVSLAQLLDDPDRLELPDPVVPRLAWEGRVSLLAAREKTGKSTLARAGAAAVSAGRPFLGQSLPPGDALWLGLEEHPSDLARGFDSFAPNRDRVRVLSSVREPFQELERWTAGLRPRLVVIDTLAAFLARYEMESGDASAWTKVMQEFTSVARATNAAIVLLHHARKGGGYRDSTAIGANVDVLLEMRSSEVNDVVRQVEAKGRWAVDDYSVVLTEEDGRKTFELDSGDAPLDMRVLKWVRINPGCSTRNVRENVQGRDMKITRALKRLDKNDMVRDQGTGNRSEWHPVEASGSGENPHGTGTEPVGNR